MTKTENSKLQAQFIINWRPKPNEKKIRQFWRIQSKMNEFNSNFTSGKIKI